MNKIPSLEMESPVPGRALFELKRSRFQKLLDHLENIRQNEPKRFRLESWFIASNFDKMLHAKSEWPDRLSSGEPLNCGAAGCVCGHMPFIFPHAFDLRLQKHFGTAAVDYTYSSSAIPGDPGDLDEETAMADFLGGTSKRWRRIIQPRFYLRDKFRNRKGLVRLAYVLKRMRKLYDKVYVEGTLPYHTEFYHSGVVADRHFAQASWTQ